MTDEQKALQEPTEPTTVEEDVGVVVPELDISDAVPWEEFMADKSLTTGEETQEVQPKPEEIVPDAAAAPQAEEAKATEPSPQPAPAEPPATVELPAFSYRADGRDYEIAGSRVRDEGLFIPAEQMQWLQQQLATARAHHGSWQHELEKARQAGGQKMAEAEAMRTGADKIVQRMQELAEGPEEVALKWFQHYRTNLPQLLAEAKADQLTAENEALKTRADAGVQEQQMSEVAQQTGVALDTLVEQIAPNYPGVDRSMIRNRVENMKGLIFSIAQEADPAGGWQKGEIVFDTAPIENEFKHAQTLLSRSQPAVDAAKANAEALKTPSAPPVVAAKKGVAVSGHEAKMPEFKSEQEYKDWVESPAGTKWAMQQLATMRENTG